MERTTFEKHPLYSQRPNELSDQAWNRLLPVRTHHIPHPISARFQLTENRQDGRGFVYVPDWKKYDYPAGQDTEYGMIYSVAVFHQMHCLGQLRRFTWMFLDAISKNDTAAMDKIKDMFAMDHMDHMNHCFDYLRQSIACSGDMTMEWPRTEPDGT
jgi:Mycotoxin biosynthesis protein UstYa